MLLTFKSEWTLWYDKTDLNICNDNWDQFLIEIQNIQTFENFWRLFNNAPILSDLPIGSNYHFFKKGIEPKWEDSENIGGGKWVLCVPRTGNLEFEKIWEISLLAMISNRFTSLGNQAINGLVASVRKHEVRFSIWTKQAHDKNLQIEIGKFWKKIIEEEVENTKSSFEFYSHSIN